MLLAFTLRKLGSINNVTFSSTGFTLCGDLECYLDIIQGSVEQ